VTPAAPLASLAPFILDDPPSPSISLRERSWTRQENHPLVFPPPIATLSQLSPRNSAERLFDDELDPASHPPLAAPVDDEPDLSYGDEEGEILEDTADGAGAEDEADLSRGMDTS